MFGSKCAVCDQRNATIYLEERDDMYCSDCIDEMREEAMELLGMLGDYDE